MKLICYYFKFLFKNTKYLTLCISVLIASMLFNIVMIGNVDAIDGSFMPFVDMIPFFINPTQRIYFVLFINVMPLIGSIPVADIIRLENNCQSHILTRQNKYIHIFSKAIVSFFCGFSLAFIFLISSVIFSQIIFNQGTQDFFYYINIFIPNNKHLLSLTIPFYDLLLTNPFLYSILYVVLLSTLGGLISLVTLSVGINFKSLLITYCFSFVVVFCGNALTFLFPGIIDVFDPLYSLGNNLIYMIEYFIIFMIVILIGLFWFIKKDVY